MPGLFSAERFAADSAAFPGELVLIEEVPDKFKAGQTKVHFGIRPLTFEVKGTAGTGMMHEFISPSTKKNSLWGKYIAQFDVLIPGFSEKGDETILLGKKFTWGRRTFTFGKNKETGEVYEAKDKLFPEALLTDEEAEAAVKTHQAAARAAGAAVPVEEVGVIEVGPELLATIAQLVNGKNASTSITALIPLGKDVVQAWVKNAELKGQLKKAGLVIVDEDGVFHLTAYATNGSAA